MCKAFEGVVLWLLRVENIFGFSQTTFNLALTIFSRFILSVKVRRSLMDGDRCWGAERELCSPLLPERRLMPDVHTEPHTLSKLFPLELEPLHLLPLCPVLLSILGPLGVDLGSLRGPSGERTPCMMVLGVLVWTHPQQPQARMRLCVP